MNQQEQNKYKIASEQVDAIFRLEGFEPSENQKAIDRSVMSGKTTLEDVIKEQLEYIKEKRTIDGFLESRNWA
jgi:hypothetical protein